MILCPIILFLFDFVVFRSDQEIINIFNLWQGKTDSSESIDNKKSKMFFESDPIYFTHCVHSQRDYHFVNVTCLSLIGKQTWCLVRPHFKMSEYNFKGKSFIFETLCSGCEELLDDIQIWKSLLLWSSDPVYIVRIPFTRRANFFETHCTSCEGLLMACLVSGVVEVLYGSTHVYSVSILFNDRSIYFCLIIEYV